MDKTWDREAAAREDLPAADFLHARYTEMLLEAGPRYADALRLLAATDALPAVFHCAAGKDRTGLLAMLVLGTLGVGHDDIVEDYALTSATMDAFRANASRDPAVAAGLANMPVMFFAADPAAMSRVLDRHRGGPRVGARPTCARSASATRSSPRSSATCSPTDHSIDTGSSGIRVFREGLPLTKHSDARNTRTGLAGGQALRAVAVRVRMRRSGGTVVGGCLRGGSVASSSVVASVTRRTASSKGSSLAADTVCTPLTLRTY